MGLLEDYMLQKKRLMMVKTHLEIIKNESRRGKCRAVGHPQALV